MEKPELDIKLLNYEPVKAHIDRLIYEYVSNHQNILLGEQVINELKEKLSQETEEEQKKSLETAILNKETELKARVSLHSGYERDIKFYTNILSLIKEYETGL